MIWCRLTPLKLFDINIDFNNLPDVNWPERSIMIKVFRKVETITPLTLFNIHVIIENACGLYGIK